MVNVHIRKHLTFRSLLEYLGSHVNFVLIACLLVVGGAWAFIEIADQVEDQKTQRFDEWAVRSLRQKSDLSKTIGPPILAEVGRDFTALGGIAVLSFVTLAVVGFLLLQRKFGAATFVAIATVGGLLLSILLKHLIDRPRPELVPHLSLVYTTSFPSGHSMLSASVYLTLGALLARFTPQRSLKIYFVAVAVALTFLVGVSRVYMGVHYPTDVLAGWTAGLVWALICWLVARYLQHRGKVEQDVEPAGS